MTAEIADPAAAASRSGRWSRSLGTRHGIMAAAAALFVEQGYDGTSIDDIVKRSGISVGSIYHQFKGKSEIYLAVAADDFDQQFAAMQRASEKAAAAGADASRAALAGVEAFLVSTWHHRELARLTLGDQGPTDYRSMRADNLERLQFATSPLRLVGRPPSPGSAARAVGALIRTAALEIVEVDNVRQARRVARYFIGLIEQLLIPGAS